MLYVEPPRPPRPVPKPLDPYLTLDPDAPDDAAEPSAPADAVAVEEPSAAPPCSPRPADRGQQRRAKGSVADRASSDAPPRDATASAGDCTATVSPQPGIQSPSGRAAGGSETAGVAAGDAAPGAPDSTASSDGPAVANDASR